MRAIKGGEAAHPKSPSQGPLFAENRGPCVGSHRPQASQDRHHPTARGSPVSRSQQNQSQGTGKVPTGQPYLGQAVRPTPSFPVQPPQSSNGPGWLTTVSRQATSSFWASVPPPATCMPTSHHWGSSSQWAHMAASHAPHGTPATELLSSVPGTPGDRPTFQNQRVTERGLKPQVPSRQARRAR